MPFYTAQCSTCEGKHPYFRSRIAERHDTPHCCGQATVKLMDTPQIGAMSFAGSQGFVATGTEKAQWIESGADLKRYMKENNFVTSAEGEERAKDARANREIENDRALDKAIHDAIEIHKN